jgi:signal transduction histidine kinase
MRPTRGRPWVVDGSLALVALATELPFVLPLPPVVVVGELAVAFAIATRRVMPFVAVFVFGVAFTAQAVAMSDPPENQLCLIALVTLAYTFGADFGLAKASLGFLLAVLAGCAHEYVNDPDYVFVFFIALVAWVPGVAVHARKTEVAALQERTAHLELDRDDFARRARLEERTRLARELHDVVSHGVSAMMIQASAARGVLHTSPSDADAALGRVQHIGEQSVGELHRLLGLLRDEDDHDAGTTPRPDLSQVPALVAQARTAGQSVDLQVDGVVRPLPESIELSAFRVIQESLTNARKHDTTAHVTVRLAYASSTLTIEVVDLGGTSVVGAPMRPGGHGLLGLRERAALLGGSFEAGPAAEGFAVRVELPTESVAS